MNPLSYPVARDFYYAKGYSGAALIIPRAEYEKRKENKFLEAYDEGQRDRESDRELTPIQVGLNGGLWTNYEVETTTRP
jgi:hypothetical protein